MNQARATIVLPSGWDSINDYVVLVLREQCLKIREQSAGGAQPNLNGRKIKNIILVLPPLAEQKRIVARVEELLRWCNALEAQLHQTRTLGAHLFNSTLHHLLPA